MMDIKIAIEILNGIKACWTIWVSKDVLSGEEKLRQKASERVLKYYLVTTTSWKE